MSAKRRTKTFPAALNSPLLPSLSETRKNRLRQRAEEYVTKLERLAKLNWQAIGFEQAPLVPLIRCTTTPYCGHCWYCKQAVPEVDK